MIIIFILTQGHVYYTYDFNHSAQSLDMSWHVNI